MMFDMAEIHPTPKNGGQFVRKYQVNESFFDSLGEDQAWLVGLLMADGCVHNDATFSLSQSHEPGLALVNAVRAMLSYTGPIGCYKAAHTLTITSRALVRNLSLFGITPRKSLTLEFPENIPSASRAAFMRGYIEGDGSVGIYDTTAKGGVPSFAPVLSFVGTSAFIKRAQEILPVAGNLTTIRRARNLAELRFNGRKALLLARWVWVNPQLPPSRKHAIIQDFLRTHSPRYLRQDPPRERGILLLASGMHPKEVAQEVGVGWRTVYRWQAASKVAHIESKDDQP